MSFSPFRDQKAFMNAMGQHPSPEMAALYKRLTDEEVAELEVAWASYQQTPCAEHATEVADACIDILYVVIGLMHSMGLDPQPLWNEVQRSNIDKIKHPCAGCAATGFIDGHGPAESEIEGEFVTTADMKPCPTCRGQGYVYEVRRRDDGKVLKPAGWEPPALFPLVRGMLLEARRLS